MRIVLKGWMTALEGAITIGEISAISDAAKAVAAEAAIARAIKPAAIAKSLAAESSTTKPAATESTAPAETAAAAKSSAVKSAPTTSAEATAAEACASLIDCRRQKRSADHHAKKDTAVRSFQRRELLRQCHLAGFHFGLAVAVMF
jgi:hypothetical protein